jgi:hypothetical protein
MYRAQWPKARSSCLDGGVWRVDAQRVAAQAETATTMATSLLPLVRLGRYVVTMWQASVAIGPAR